MQTIKRSRLLNLLLLPLIALGLLGTVAAAPAPETTARAIHAGNLRGQITAIDGATFVLTTEDGDLTVQTNEETHFYIIGQTDVTLDDFNVGDEVVVRGAINASGVLTARRVAAVPAGDMVAGRITALADNSLTLLTRDDATIVVSVRDEAYLVIPGHGTTTWGEAGDRLQVGMGVAAFGELADDGASLTAHTIIVHARPQPPHRGVAGIMVTIADDSFELQLRNETVITVQTTPDTEYFMRGVEDPTLADFEVGMIVLVQGHRADDGTFIARRVALRPPGELRAGVISAIDGADITLDTLEQGSVIVTTTADTIFRDGRDLIDLSDLAPGDRMLARAAADGDGDAFVATHVVRQPTP